ncbi:uncharacterized protein [Oscarella lobularis]|uniref:uncharacterized protein n=1 Tax=Oscarella lobularis TaxID=121494 RepID=UPI003314328B
MKLLLRLSLFCVLLILSSSITTEPPTDSEDPDPNTKTIPLVQYVRFPGVRFIPSTGKELRVFELNNQTLRGMFVAHDGHVIYFKSTCSGKIRVWQKGGRRIVNHEYLSKGQNIHFVNIEGHRFVYDNDKTYSYANHKSKRHALNEYKQRRSAGHESEEELYQDAVHELSIDSYTPLLVAVSQALGEFGIYGYTAPCSLLLHQTARSISTKLISVDMNLTEFDSAEKNRSLYQSYYLRPQHKRAKRECLLATFLGKFVVGTIIQRLVEPVVGWVVGKITGCEDLRNDPNNDNCTGMCGEKCNCWKWVCGNCCNHTGCYQHDVCKGRSFDIPVGFSCLWFHCAF